MALVTFSPGASVNAQEKHGNFGDGFGGHGDDHGFGGLGGWRSRGPAPIYLQPGQSVDSLEGIRDLLAGNSRGPNTDFAQAQELLQEVCK